VSWKAKDSWSFPINKELKQLINKKHRLWCRFQETRSEITLNEYKRIRNLVKKECSKLKQKIQNDVACSSKSNPKKFWKFVRSKLSFQSGVADLKVASGENHHYVTDDSEKAEILSDYFSTVYTLSTASNFEPLALVYPNEVMMPLVINTTDLLLKLSSLDVNKSAGPDGIHPRIICESRFVMADCFTKLFNLSIESGKIPADWKLSYVTAIHKKGSKNQVDNYRPISLTCVLCKILESCIRDHLMNYFLTNKLFSIYQYGFIKKRSCILQLLKIMDNWVNVLENGGQVDVIYTDFEKAFDKVPHDKLLSKLISYGVSAKIVDWVRDFLYSRTQQVKVNSCLSKPKAILSGIPQGTVLGPVLFIIFINDMPDIFQQLCYLYLFADDAKMYKSIATLQDAETLNMCLNEMDSWCDKWCMKLNRGKCQTMTICGSGRSPLVYNYKLTSESEFILARVDVVKDLGILFDSDLQFKSHIYSKIGTARKMLGIINRCFTNVNKHTFLLLYKSFVRSHLEYGNCLWNPYKVGLLTDLEKVQKHATKLVCKTKNMCYIERLKFLNLPTLKYRRFRGDMIEVFKILNGYYDCVCAPGLELSSNTHTRGNISKLKVNYSRLHVTKYSFCNRVVSVWNKLPDFVVSSPSVLSFKVNLDKAWSKEAFLFDFKAYVPGLSI